METKNFVKIGEKYGLLSVESEIYKKEGSRRYFVDVTCECGKSKSVNEYNLRTGAIKSCGCLRDQKVSSLKRTHDLYGIKEYTSWILMKQRCTNSNSPDYKNYGGRGITISEDWINSFENFLRDMGNRPDNTSLDRIDVNGNYEPSNCRWADDSMQAHNRRKIKSLKNKPTSSNFIGVSYCKKLKKWSSKLVHSGKVVFQKFFDDELLAAKAYDDISFEMYGDKPNEKIIKENKNECY